MRRTCLALLLAPAVLSACVIDTVPLPEETPDPAPAGFVNANAMFYTASPAILVGVEGAVPPTARVVVLNTARSNWSGESNSSDDGSFNMPVNAGAGETLQIDAFRAGELIASGELMLEAASGDAADSNDDLRAYLEFGPSNGVGDGVTGGGGDTSPPGASNLVSVSAPDGDGMVIVAGPPGTVPAGIAIIVANVNGGNATVAYAATDGAFEASLMAEVGDELQIFAVEPAASNAGTAPITVFVP